MPRMRTAEKALILIREMDPETDISLHYLRGLIKSGRFPSTAVGRKRLVDVDKLVEFVSNGESNVCADSSEPSQAQGIRPVQV